MGVQVATGNLVICRMFSKVWDQLSRPPGTPKATWKLNHLKVVQGLPLRREQVWLSSRALIKKGQSKSPSLFENCLGNGGAFSLLSYSENIYS